MGLYLRQTYAKDLDTLDKEKKYKYLQPFLYRRRYFTPMVYSADVITRMDSIAAQQRISLLLSNNLKRGYL